MHDGGKGREPHTLIVLETSVGLRRVHAARADNAQIDRHDGGILDAKFEHAAVNFSTHQESILLLLDGRGEGCHGPIEQFGQRLAHLIGVPVDGLLAHQDNIRFFFLDERLERLGHQQAVEIIVVGVHA